jgi:hypothetical protein
LPGSSQTSNLKSLHPISWGDFAGQEPDLASFGAGRLTVRPAYLATVRLSGAPRVHPVTPIFAASGLFLFMEPTSPKGRDLRKRGWFAMHSGVPDNAGTGGEFSVSGRGLAVDDPEQWSLVSAAAGYTPEDRYILFELRLSEARCHGYGDIGLPEKRVWVAGE